MVASPAAAARRLLVLAQGAAAVAFVARVALPLSPTVSNATFAVCLALLAVGAATTAAQARSPHRAIAIGVTASAVAALVSRIALAVDIAGGGPREFLTPSLVVFLLGVHPALLVGFGAALGLRKPGLRAEVALDALLLVAAAAIVHLLLPYGLAELDALPTLAAKAAYVYWQAVTAGELGVVALLVAWRSEAIGVRTGAAALLGTIAFALANAVSSRALLAPGAVAATSVDDLWLLCVAGFAFALWATLGPDGGAAVAAALAGEKTGSRAALRQQRGIGVLRGGSLVVAILICAASSLVLGFTTRPRPALAVGVALFGVLGAVRFAFVLVAQRRETAALASTVDAERELSAALEERVAARTAELAEAQRVLQRMWVLGQHIAVELKAARVLRHFVEALMDVARADGAAVGLVTEDGDLRIAAAIGITAAMEGDTLPRDGSVIGRVVRERRTLSCSDVERDDDAARTLHSPSQARQRAQGNAVRAFVAVPLQRRGETIGAISLLSREPRDFTPADIGRIESLADMLSVALANAELVENLRQAEWRFRTLFRAAPDAVLTVFNSGRVREANDCVRDLLGLDPVQVVGQRFVDLVRAEDRDRLDASLRDALAGRPTRLEVRCLRRTHTLVTDGAGEPTPLIEERVVALAASRLPETDPPVALVIGRDITGEREMRARLLETERLAAVGELVAGVAHEVNNPLSSISAFAQLLLRDGGLTGEQRESVEVIRAETTRASQVVKDLLAFARRSEPRREALDLNALVERTLRLRNYQLTSSNLQVELSLADDLPPVVGDARQLQQVVLNLVTNSIQAMMPSGAGTLRVTTRVAAAAANARPSAATAGPRVELEVVDTGPGIPPAARAHIFEPFFTTKPEGEGTGLGLSVSYGIVTAHGGTIRLAETSPRGTRFVVTLPAIPAIAVGASGDVRDAADAGRSPGAEGAASALPRRSPLAGLRLLFIDDEPALRSGMEAFGRLRGFTVVTAPEGGAGLAAVQRTAFDAIVCDLRMPGMGGVAFHEALSRERPGLARRTVFITGDVMTNGDVGPSSRQPTVPKPFTFERLEEALVTVLKDSR
ncbi:MAG TPA: ATP-binding protein [Gemmatimonadaceae bacterium]|nr:ATP-binding protein [Gemmatimonadaceae bacterium]